MVTGNRVHASYNPLNQDISELQLDMGVRLPLCSREEIGQDVDGQNPAGNFVVKVPIRNADGNVTFRPALISRGEDVSLGYLPYTRENIIKQVFKMQGQRYGWGGMFNARDCSALMMDVFRTMGLRLPRNSGEQGQMAVGRFHEMPSTMTFEERKRILDDLEPGTGLYMSGHAMLYLGKYRNEHYMIHDFSGFYKNENGALKYYRAREVAVTPLSILLSSGKTYLEGLYGAREFVLPDQGKGKGDSGEHSGD